MPHPSPQADPLKYMAHVWQNQPELHQLKCVGPFLEGSKDSTASGVSRGIPEIKSSKTEHTNTQQGLPRIRVYLAHN
jgi:hypothetical protein